MTPDDSQYAQWLDDYTDLLVAELDSRDCEIDRDVARDFIESTISMIATTTGTSERQARLSITETAVPAWATMLIESHDEDEAGDYVAISGVQFAGLQTWANAVLPLIDVLDDAGAGTPIDAAMEIAEVIGLLEASFLVDPTFGSALELPLPEEMAHSLVADLGEVTAWMGSKELRGAMSQVGGQIELPDLLSDLDAGDGEALVGAFTHLAQFGDLLASAINDYHRHIGSDLEDVLRYPDIDG